MIAKMQSNGPLMAAALLSAAAALGVAAHSPWAREGAAPIDRLDEPALAVPAPEQGLVVDIAALSPGQGAGAPAADRLVAVGERGRVLFSDDSGASWRQAASPVAVELTAVAFSESGVGVAAGHDGAILRSSDAGETWSRVADGRALFERVVAAAQERVAASEAALAQADEDSREDAEFALDDENYRLQTAETSNAYGPSWPFLDVVWSGPKTVWAIGAYGLAFRSTSDGESWENVGALFENPDDFHLYSMTLTSGGALLAVGEAGMIFRSGDQGATWERYDTDDGASLFGVAEIGAPGARVLIAYGFGDSYQISQDDGLSWERRDLDGTSILIGHVSGGAQESLRTLGASGRMIELSLDGVVAQTQPLGDRSFLSVGVDLSEADGGRLLLATETGLRFAKGGDAQ